jgi:hypothetical protein
MAAIERRIANLERIVQPTARPPIAQIIIREGEDEEAAKARYRAEHGLPDDTFFVVIVLVSPKHGGET